MAQSSPFRATVVKTAVSAAEIASALAAGSELPRVAMVWTPRDDDESGDAGDYVRELSRRLALLGYQVDIWTRRVAPQAEIEALTPRVRVIRVHDGARDTAVAGTAWSERALEFIAQHRLRYAFIASHRVDAGNAARRLCAQLKAPHVHTPHSTFSDDGADSLNEAQRRICADCDVVIATTPLELDHLVREGEVPAAKVRLVPPGYDDHRFFPVSDTSRAEIRQRLGFKGKVILALGRPAPRQGFDLLIESFALVAQREPRAMLHLAVGAAGRDAAEEELLRELRALAARRGLAERIRFGAPATEAERADHFRAADLFVLCSRHEPVGTMAIEAMACGTPTVLTVHGGLHRIFSFGRHALFADPFDREDLGIMMAKVLKLPRLRERLARMGAHHARSLFTWTGIAHQLVAAVEQRATAHAAVGAEDGRAAWLTHE